MQKIMKYLPIFLTVVLLSFVVTFAWYVMQETAKGNTSSETATIDYDYTLYHYNGSNWINVDQEIAGVRTSSVEHVTLNNTTPGSIDYFAMQIVCTDTTIHFSMSLDGIASSLNTSSFKPYTSTDTGVYLTSDLTNPIYTFNESKQVIVDGKVLYKITDNELDIDEYRVENAYRTYVCQSTTNSVTINNSLVPSKGEAVANMLNNKLVSNQTLIKDQVLTVVFGLEFNEAASLVDGNSNCFQYQKLFIDSIKLSAEAD